LQVGRRRRADGDRFAARAARRRQCRALRLSGDGGAASRGRGDVAGVAAANSCGGSWCAGAGAVVADGPLPEGAARARALVQRDRDQLLCRRYARQRLCAGCDAGELTMNGSM
ncbi:hypothetical protein KO13_14585, partial [Listeria monocytogenes]